MKAPAVVRDAIQEGKTRNARTIKRTLHAVLNKDAAEKSFSARTLRICSAEKILLREAKMPKKKPLTTYKAVFTIWLKLSPPNPDPMIVPPVNIIAAEFCWNKKILRKHGLFWLHADRRLFCLFAEMPPTQLRLRLRSVFLSVAKRTGHRINPFNQRLLNQCFKNCICRALVE